MSILKRKETAFLFYVIPMVAIVFIDYTGIAKPVGSELISWAIVIWIFSYFVGIYNMFKSRLAVLLERKPGWQYSILLFASFFGILIFGFMQHDFGYNWIVENLLTPMTLGVKIYGFVLMIILARGAKTRNFDVTFLLIVLIVVMFGKSALGPAMIPDILVLKDFFEGPINTGVMRAIKIATGIGLIVIFIKGLLGLEKAYIGEIVLSAEE